MRNLPNPIDDETKAALAAMGAHLRRVRLAKGLTQEAASEALGVDEKYLARVELGRINLTMGSFLKLAKFYGVKPGQLLRPGKPLVAKVGRPKKK